MKARRGENNNIWIIAATALLLLVTIELAIIHEAVQENRFETNACKFISKRIDDLKDEMLTCGSLDMDPITVQELEQILSPEQQLIWAKSFWTYDFYIDGRWIPLETWKSGMEIEAPASGRLMIRFIQREKARKLPLAWHLKGCLTGGDPLDSFETHMGVVAQKECKITKASEIGLSSPSSIDTIVTYTFDDLIPGSLIRIVPDPVLESFPLTSWQESHLLIS